jgi:hypothetical protein
MKLATVFVSLALLNNVVWAQPARDVVGRTWQRWRAANHPGSLPTTGLRFMTSPTKVCGGGSSSRIGPLPQALDPVQTSRFRMNRQKSLSR